MSRILRIVKLCIFYLIYKRSYKKLEFKAYIAKPLRIEGKKYITLKKHSNIKKYCWLLAVKSNIEAPDLIIGEGCDIGDFNHIVAVKKVIIEDYVITANRVYISDNYHEFEDINTPVMFQPIRYKADVVIGKGSWIGENVSIIGAKIGKNCVIGANAVVTRDIPDYCVAAGVPAKVIKRYNFETNKWQKTDMNGNFISEDEK